jgi:hypothetical protein
VSRDNEAKYEAAIRADERSRVLDEIETFMDNGATGWQNLRDYIARMRQEAGQ